MILLLIDTSGATCGVALQEGETTLYAAARQLSRAHSTELLPMVDQALSACDLSLGQVDGLACVTGPGSFTGVRIGVSTVRAFAHATGKPCMGITSLESLAYAASRQVPADVYCPMIDARSGQAYAAAFGPYGKDWRLLPDSAGSLESFLASAASLTGRMLFCGDGALAYRGRIEESLGERAVFPKEAGFAVQPEYAVRLAMLLAEERMGSYETLTPYYLRAPQAERERLAREGKA